MEAKRKAPDAVKTKSKTISLAKAEHTQFNRAGRRICTVRALVGSSQISRGCKRLI
jgi:hypothetical protein